MRCFGILLGLAVVASAGLSGGCGSGESKYVVTGQITKDGKPLPVRPQVGELKVEFRQVDAKNQPQAGPFPAEVNSADGTYRVIGLDDRGVPAGKYHIIVQWFDDGLAGGDKLKGQFDASHSKIYREVNGSGKIDIDLAQPEG